VPKKCSVIRDLFDIKRKFITALTVAPPIPLNHLFCSAYPPITWTQLFCFGTKLKKFFHHRHPALSFGSHSRTTISTFSLLWNRGLRLGLSDLPHQFFHSACAYVRHTSWADRAIIIICVPPTIDELPGTLPSL